MIRRVLNIDNYWKVIVYFDIDYNFFNYIVSDLDRLNCSNRTINTVYNNMRKYKAKAVTISNLNLYKSVVLFNKHKSYYDYINSIIHEAEHIKQSMLYAYDVDDSGEPPAYTVGYIASQMIMLLNLNLNKSFNIKYLPYIE